MKPWFAKALKEVTLDDVGFENREVYEPDTRDARYSMRYMSAFHRQPRDHYREERDARMGTTITGGTQKECEPETSYQASTAPVKVASRPYIRR